MFNYITIKTVCYVITKWLSLSKIVHINVSVALMWHSCTLPVQIIMRYVATCKPYAVPIIGNGEVVTINQLRNDPH